MTRYRLTTETTGNKTAYMFRNFTKTIAICCVFLSMTLSASAQQLSPYEQKRYKLAEETIDQMANKLGDEKEAFLALVGIKLITNNDIEGNLGELYYVEELIEAAGTGSTTFYGYDIIQNYSYRRALIDIYNSWKEKRNALDKTRTQADIAREYKIKPTGGTIDKMIQLVRKDFEKWAKRGTYEKTIDYQNRLNTQGIAKFDSICNALIAKGICFGSPAKKVVNAHYDPDEEQYIATIIYGDDSYKGQVSLVSSVPIDRAQDYKMGTVTKVCVDGKWIVPVESEYEGRTTGYFKTKFTTTAKTAPLRICFKDIKFGYGEISDELKNHCFTSEEYNANRKTYYNKLNDNREVIKRRINKLKDDYGYSDFESWFMDYEPDSEDEDNDFTYYENIDITLRGDLLSSYSYAELRKYEAKLNRIQTMLNVAEKDLSQKRGKVIAEEETTQFLSNVFNEYKNKPVIKKISIEGSKVIFYTPKKEQIQGNFTKYTLTNSNGEPYEGVYKPNAGYRLPEIRCTGDDNMILYIGDATDWNTILIINKEDVYLLSPKVTQQLYEQGIFRQ